MTVNCEKCGREMTVSFLGQFYTEYRCPHCGRVSYYCPFLDGNYDIVDGDAVILYDNINKFRTGEDGKPNDEAGNTGKTGG